MFLREPQRLEEQRRNLSSLCGDRLVSTELGHAMQSLVRSAHRNVGHDAELAHTADQGLDRYAPRITEVLERSHTNRPRQQRLNLRSGSQQLSCEFVGFPFLLPVPWEWVGMEQQVAQFMRACEAIPIDRGGALWSHDYHGPAESVRGISTHSRDRLVRERNQRDDNAVRLDRRDEVGQRSRADTPGLAENLRSVSWQGTRRYFWQLNLGKSYAFF